MDKKTKIILSVIIIICLLIIAFVITNMILRALYHEPGNSLELYGNPDTDEGQIESIYLAYLKAGQDCDIDEAFSMITEKSKEIIHYTCSNLKNETKCYIGRDHEIKINGDNAVLYLTTFNHKIENPFFFSKENGEWKFNFYKMWAGLVMAGSTCDSGWGWRNNELRQEFCEYFEEGECPD